MNTKAKAKKSTDAPVNVIQSYKGFYADMKCRDFQYEIGKTYTHAGAVAACSGGFHACEYPLDVFKYYSPAGSTFATVDQSGDLSRDSDDSKVASRSITIKAKIDIAGLVTAAIEYTTSRCSPVDAFSPASNSGYSGAASNSGDSGAASNSGDRGAASNSGYRGAASNSGYRGAASNSGYSGAASNSGYSGAASNSGYRGAASNSGDRGAASNSGEHGTASDFSGTGKVRSCASGAIVCMHRADGGSIQHIRSSKVGENGIKPDTWYTLDASGEFVEVSE